MPGARPARGDARRHGEPPSTGAALAAGYVGAGTVEFIADATRGLGPNASISSR